MTGDRYLSKPENLCVHIETTEKNVSGITEQTDVKKKKRSVAYTKNKYFSTKAKTKCTKSFSCKFTDYLNRVKLKHYVVINML